MELVGGRRQRRPPSHAQRKKQGQERNTLAVRVQHKAMQPSERLPARLPLNAAHPVVLFPRNLLHKKSLLPAAPLMGTPQSRRHFLPKNG